MSEPSIPEGFTPPDPAAGELRSPVTIRQQVNWADMDAYGHVNNAVHLTWFENGRFDYFEQIGLSAVYDAQGIGPILRRTEVDYLAPVAYPDSLLVSTWTASLGRTSFVLLNEVWSNDYAKWVLLDAKYDYHFERNGVPLSALEVHEAVRADGGKNLVKVKGPKRQTVAMKTPEYPVKSAANYWWVAYHVNQDRFTQPSGESRLVILDNSAYRETTWIRDDRKHWAYAAKAFLPTTDRHQIEWTPGVPDLKVRQSSPTELNLTIHSSTPNFKAYQIRSNGAPWKTLTGNSYRWKLVAGKNKLDVRTQNQFDVNGPTVTATVLLNSDVD